ncbi:MAG: TolC family protein [Alistipes sp.]|nr:TolC family protein [Alistipes sp.]
MRTDKISRFLALILILPVISSCWVQRRSGSLEVEPHAYFRDADQDPSSIADIPWRLYFNDPILVGLIEEGLENNRNLEIAVSRIRQAEATLAAARAAYFPQVSLTGIVSHTQLSNGTRGKSVLGYPSNQYTLGAAVTWEADIWGKLTMQKRAQYAAYIASAEYANLVATSLISNIATTYYSLLALDSQLAVTRQTVEILEETSRTMQALMEAGLQTGAAVQQTNALLYGTMVTIPDLAANIQETENSLSILLGRIPGPIHRSSLDQQVGDTTMRHGIPAVSLSRRPDVAQAEWSFRQAWELTGAAKAALYPSITLGSSGGSGSLVGYTATTLSGFFKTENLIATIVGGINHNIFDGRQLRSSYESAREAELQALLTFEQTVLEAAEEVCTILFSYRTSLDKNPIRAKQIEALETAVYFTEELLKAGEVNYTEVLTAKQDLLSAQLDRISDRLEQLQYSVTLYRALGGGVD